MEKVQISRISVKKEKKDGTRYVTKAGKPFEMMSILIKGGKYDGKWASSCLFDGTHPAYAWKEGSTVEVVLEQNGEFLNFKTPDRLDLLEMRVKALEDAKSGASTANIASQVFTPPIEDRVSPDDLPF